MQKFSGTINRLSDGPLRLVATIALCLVVGSSHPPLWATDAKSPGLEIARWTREAGFKRQAMILSDKDRALYHRIFALQKAGKWADAKSLVANLDDPLLMGHVLYQHYMVEPGYKSHFAELNHWLHDFGDLPNADKIYTLAQRRHSTQDADVIKPFAQTVAVKNEPSSFKQYMKEHFARDVVKPNNRQTKIGDRLARDMKNDIAQDRVSRALDKFNRDAVILTSAQQGVLLAQVAMGYYHNHKFSHAKLVALRAMRQRGSHQPIASWIAGLSAWRMEDYAAAENYFARIVESQETAKADPWFYTAGAFWAARAAGRQGNTESRLTYLEKAGHYPTTFYGLLAHGALGRQFMQDKSADADTAPSFNAHAVRVLMASPSGERVLALLDLQQNDLAVAELEQLIKNTAAGDDGQPVREAMSALAASFELTDIQEQLAEQKGRNAVLQAAFENETMFPVLQEAVATSKTVDPALIHALIRQESRFNPKAQNRTTGASGLMQLMPQTARFMGSKKTVDQKELFNPSVNLQLGQRYVDYLLHQDNISGNLFYLAVAYNAGPGNLQTWQQELDTRDDPLLFIESVPFGQTRSFVEHVMANYWMYRMRLGQGAPDVQALIDGAWPQHMRPNADGTFTLALAD